MLHYFLPGLLLACLLFGCDTPAPGVDYDALTDEQRRHPENALASMRLHAGLDAQLFAAEPHLINPTNMDIDARGRVWICEAQNYRRFNHDHPARDAGDRIVILEDRDGRADTSKTFFQGTAVNAKRTNWSAWP